MKQEQYLLISVLVNIASSHLSSYVKPIAIPALYCVLSSFYCLSSIYSRHPHDIILYHHNLLIFLFLLLWWYLIVKFNRVCPQNT